MFKKRISTFFATNKIAIFIIGLFAFGAYKYKRQSKYLALANEEIKKLKIVNIVLIEEIKRWKNNYYSQISWLQDYQHIPNPREEIQTIILKLEELKVQKFADLQSFSIETNEAIHSLKGENLKSSFITLARIIENILKNYLLKNEKFQEQYKIKIEANSLNLGNLIEFSSKSNLVEQSKISILKNIKDQRNECTHEIDEIESDNNYLIGFNLKAIEIIYEILEMA